MQKVEAVHLADGAPFAKPIREALDTFWDQLYAAARLILKFRNKNYFQRLWKEDKHEVSLADIKRVILKARDNLSIALLTMGYGRTET